MLGVNLKTLCVTLLFDHFNRELLGKLQTTGIRLEDIQYIDLYF